MVSANDIRVDLDETTTEHYLGVMVNNKLKWNDQIDSCVNKAINMPGMLKKTFGMSNRSCNFTKHMSHRILNIVC